MENTASATAGIGSDIPIARPCAPARTYGQLSLPLTRKGNLFLPRLKVSLFHESLIEERTLWCLDADLSVLSVTRARPVTFHTPDGAEHTYTPDFNVELELTNGSTATIILEVKPWELLRDIIGNDVLGWQLKQAKLKSDGLPLWVVTDRDIGDLLPEHARTFGLCFHSVPQPDLRTHLLAELQAGPLPMGQLVERVTLRFTPGLQTPQWQLQLRDTLHGLVARGEVHADLNVTPDEHCTLWLASMSGPTEHKALGVEIGQYIHRSLTGWGEAPVPVEEVPQPDEHHHLAMNEFLDSKSGRGKQYLKLFSRYSDPRVPLDADLVQELSVETGFSHRALYRFKRHLHDAGAPGITFQQLVPHLKTEKSAPRNTVELSVRMIIADLVTSFYLKPIDNNGKPTGRARSVRDLYFAVRKACQNAKLQPPAQTTIQRYLDALYQKDPVAFTLTREGQKAASRLVGRQGGNPSTHYGELIGVDCTPCDVFYRKGQLVLEIRPRGKKAKETARATSETTERATMVMFVEEATSEIVLSYVVRGHASGAVILDGFRRLMLGERTLQEGAGVVHHTPFVGLPSKVRMDSGNEFKNRHIKRALESLGITVIPRNKGTVHIGGLEERTIRTIVSTHHILPGTTMNNVKARGEYNAQKGATLSFEMLSQFQQLNVEQFNLDCAPRQSISRHDHARELIRTGKVRIRQPSPEQRRFLTEQMRPVEYRLCSPEGVRMFGLRYVSFAPEMEHLIRQRATVELVYLAEDIRTANLVHPASGELLLLKAVPYPGLDFSVPLAKSTWDLFRQEQTGARTQIKDRVERPHEVLERIRKLQGLSPLPAAPPNQKLPVVNRPAAQEDEIKIPVSTIPFIRIPPIDAKAGEETTMTHATASGPL